MTSITRFDPIRLMPRWFEDFDEINFQKGLKIRETDKDIIAEAVVAGVPADQVEVNIEDGVLTIKAESKTEEGDQTSSYQYYYTAALSGGQWDKTEAEVEHGVVKVIIPKAEAARPRKIEVKSKAK